MYINDRSLAGCDGQRPVTSNQHAIAQLLLTELQQYLPVVKTSPTYDGNFHVYVQTYDAKHPNLDSWIDLADYKGVIYMYVCVFVCVCACVYTHITAIFMCMYKRTMQSTLIWIRGSTWLTTKVLYQSIVLA